MAEKSINPIDSLIGLVRSELINVNTCMPGVIVSYSSGTASVRPTPKKRFADGDVLDYPIIPNVRVCWPSFAGGAAGIKGPVNPGDNCLLVFSQQAVDGTNDPRIFDLQDAYAVMCDLGLSGKGDSSNNSDLTVFFNGGNIRITSGGQVNINAPGGVNISAPNTSINGNVVHEGGSIVSLGNKIDGTHTHGGIDPGGGTTAPPNP